MTDSFDHPYDVLRFCRDAPAAALIVVTSVTGGAMRSAGALMAVGPDSVAGYVSNGCVDADIVTRARQGCAGQYVYGSGSPFRDIVLPCGGRIEIAIVQRPDRKRVSELVAKLASRKPARLSISQACALIADGADPLFTIELVPPLRLRMAGRGEALQAVARLASASGFEVVVQSPDALTDTYVPLLDPANIPPSEDDARTAVVLLFHDHDWEPYLLRQALNGPAFYIGAMGSARTQAARLARLRSMDIPSDKLAQVRGPIGLLPAMRDANLLAISILAEIVDVARSKALL